MPLSRPTPECFMPPNDESAVLDAPATAVVHKPLPHDSARLHVQGAATYIDDIGEPGQIVDARPTDDAEHGRGHGTRRRFL